MRFHLLLLYGCDTRPYVQPMSTQYSWVPVHFMTPSRRVVNVLCWKKSVLREKDRQMGKKKKKKKKKKWLQLHQSGQGWLELGYSDTQLRTNVGQQPSRQGVTLAISVSANHSCICNRSKGSISCSHYMLISCLPNQELEGTVVLLL